MEVEKLVPTIMALLMVAMIVAVGVLLMDKTRTAVLDDVVIANETVVFTAGAGTTTNNDLVSIASAINASGTTFDVSIADASAGTVTEPTGANGNLYLKYTYGADTPSSLALDSGKDAVGAISTDWYSLIVTIIVLTLILGMVIASFYFSDKRR